MRQVQSSWHTDDAMRDGYLEVCPDPDYPHQALWWVSPATWTRLAYGGGIPGVAAWAAALQPGEYQIPLALISVEERREVELALSMAETLDDPSDDASRSAAGCLQSSGHTAGAPRCTLPTCLQDAVSATRGFPLCATHAALLADWDALLG